MKGLGHPLTTVCLLNSVYLNLLPTRSRVKDNKYIASRVNWVGTEEFLRICRVNLAHRPIFFRVEGVKRALNLRLGALCVKTNSAAFESSNLGSGDEYLPRDH